MKNFIVIAASLFVLVSCSKERETGTVYKINPDVTDINQLPEYNIGIYVAWESKDSTMYTINKLEYIFNGYHVGKEVERKR